MTLQLLLIVKIPVLPRVSTAPFVTRFLLNRKLLLHSVTPKLSMLLRILPVPKQVLLKVSTVTFVARFL